MSETPPGDDLYRISRYLTGESGETRAEFARWLEADPQRRQLYEELEAIWHKASRPTNPWDVEAALSRIHRATDASVLDLAASRSSGLRDRRVRVVARDISLRVAASIVIVAGLGLGAKALWQDRQPHADTVAVQSTSRVIATSSVQRAMIDLPDGTRVTLGPASTLSYEADLGTSPRGSRSVQLDGAAFFEVKHDASRPFVVRTARATATDLGTKFIVRAYADARTIDVAVTEGLVSLKPADRDRLSPKDSILIGVAEAGQVDSIGRLHFEHGIDLERATAWTRGELVFTNAPVREVIAEVRRWYGVDLRLVEPVASRINIDRVRFTARYTDEPALVVARELAKVLGLELEDLGTTIVLR